MENSRKNRLKTAPFSLPIIPHFFTVRPLKSVYFQVSLGLGSLLAMTVLLDIVAGAMPKSNSIPLLGEFREQADE